MDEEAFAMFLWYTLLEEEEERKRRCPNCGSKRISYNADRKVKTCLNCKFKWSGNNR
jgi:ribosomal protein L37AE/L43A